MSDLDVSQYLGIFLDEAEEQLQQLDETIVQLEQRPDDPGLLNTIFRVSHTLKGASASMGFNRLATLTHRMESVLDSMRQGKLAVSREIINILLASLDKLRVLKDSIAAGNGDEGEVSDVVAQLEAVLEEPKLLSRRREANGDTLGLDDIEQNVIRAAQVKGFQAYEIRVELEAGCQMKSARAYLVLNNLKDLGEVIKSVPHTQDLEAEKFDDYFTLAFVSREDADTLANVVKSISEIKSVTVRPIILEEDRITTVTAMPAPGQAQSGGENSVRLEGKTEERRFNQTVRVDVQRLENLMNLVGELVIDRTRLAEVGNVLKNSLGNEEMLETLEEVSLHIGRITTDLQEEIMKARMFPIDQVFNRFPRMVRDLAQKAGKEIDFIVEGRETELDRTVIEEIGDPLIHLLRNAIDHGIEKPDIRLKQGKPRHGTIHLKAFHQENQIVITVEDDGAGMNSEKIKATAVARGIISPEAGARLNTRDALNLIFLPGFSTSEEITDVSGRGVGMDIVRSHIEKINGSIDIQSTPGKGTCFTIKLPLTLAINRSLLVNVGRRVLAFPLANVVEIINVNPSQIQYIQRQKVVVVRGRVLPLVSLGQVLDLETNLTPGQSYAVVIVGLAEKQVGFIVDNLIGEQEIVIKSLGNYIGKVQGIAGATILGDGSVALILDISSLINLAGMESGSELAS